MCSPYGGKRRFGEGVQIQTGRIFIVLITLFAYAVALRAPETIFEWRFSMRFPVTRLVALAGRGVFLEGQHEVGRARYNGLGGCGRGGVAIFQHAVPAPAPGRR